MLLSAIELARSMVGDRYANILIISANRIEDENFRFLNYAIFSDGAVSCLVQRDVDVRPRVGPRVPRFRPRLKASPNGPHAGVAPYWGHGNVAGRGAGGT